MEGPDKLLSEPGDKSQDLFESKFVSKLTSPNKQKREMAISLLCLWLTCRKEVNEADMCKILKQLLCCVRHAEKAPVHADLIGWITSAMEKLDVELSLLFFRAFLTTLRTEWGAIESHQVDKFQLLLKQCVIRMFAVLGKHAWDTVIIQMFMGALVDRAFLAEDDCAADGVNQYIADIYLQELKHFFPIQEEIFDLLLQPFWMVLAKGHAFAEMVRDKVFFSFSEMGYRVLKAQESSQRLDYKDECVGFLALTMPISTAAAKLAALPSVTAPNTVWLGEVQQKFDDLRRFAAESVLCSSLNRITDVASPQSYAQTANCSGDDMELDSNGGSVSPHQIVSSGSCGRRTKRHQQIVSPPHLFKDDDSSCMNNENVPPQNDCAGFLVKDGFTECSHDAESSKLSSLERRQKHAKDRVFGVVMPIDKNEVDALPVPQLKNEGMEEIFEEVGLLRSPCVEVGASAFCEENARAPDAIETGLGPADSVVSNLTKRFDSIADESNGQGNIGSPKISSSLIACSANSAGKKRKSWRCSPAALSDSDSPSSLMENSTLSPGNTPVDSASTKKAKKVRFSLKHNIVWRPCTPLPPHSVRVPPSATPRGSAMKKGVTPGPILVGSELSPVSPKRKKAALRRTPPSGSRIPKNAKLSKKGCLSPR